MLGWLLLIGCEDGVGVSTSAVADDTAAVQPAAQVSWYRDVEPILQANCLSCHADEGISFSLEHFEVAAAMAGPIAAATAAGTMPPWPADETDCLPLRDRRELTDEEIALLAEWAALDAPEGDPSDAPDADTDTQSSIELDVWKEMSEAYTPDATVSDDYRCFVIDPGLEEDTFVTGAAVFPGNYSVVHHVILYTDPSGNAAALDAADEAPGYTCFGGPGFDDTAVIGGWVPGSAGLAMPEDSGLRLSAGTQVVMQMHYHSDDAAESDQTAFALDLEESVDTEVYLYPLADTSLSIPPGAEGHTEGWSRSFSYGVNLTLWGGTPHMHRLGTAIKISITPPESEEQCVISIPEWDFDYQQFYRLQTPYTIEDGSELSLECVYDNPTDEEVNWGDGTGDEMCLVYAMISL